VLQKSVGETKKQPSNLWTLKTGGNLTVDRGVVSNIPKIHLNLRSYYKKPELTTKKQKKK